jgi:hypothetical protein
MTEQAPDDNTPISEVVMQMSRMSKIIAGTVRKLYRKGGQEKRRS